MWYWCRARQHPPLGHQVSHSGKGSIGQPPRIEAFWPALGDPYKMGPTPPQGATPRSESRGKKRSPKKRAFVTSLREVPGVGSRSPGDESEMVDLQELGRPVGSDGGAPEKKSPAGVQLTRHLEYDILQCIAKNRPEVKQPPLQFPVLSSCPPPAPLAPWAQPFPPRLTPHPSRCTLSSTYPSPCIHRESGGVGAPLLGHSSSAIVVTTYKSTSRCQVPARQVLT